MAINVTLNNIVSGFNLQKINENFTILKNALVDALSVSGQTPNSMTTDLDMDSNDVLNVGNIDVQSITINGDLFTPDALLAKGDAATITVGAVTTGAAGSSVIVTNSGTTNAAVLDFTIPRGNTGASGGGSGDLVATQNLNDVSSKPTAFANIKQAASETATGVVELATNAEALAGSDTTRVVTPAALAFVLTSQAAFALPLGSVLDWTDPSTTAPSGFVFPNGQAISRTTYAAYFAKVGTMYGAGNGTTTFNVPDLCGRVVAGADNMGGIASKNRLTGLSGGVNGDTMGGTGGVETHTLSSTEMPVHLHTANPPSTTTSSNGSHSHTISTDGTRHGAQGLATSSFFGSDGNTNADSNVVTQSTSSASSHTHTVDIASFNTGNAGSGGAHNNVQPTIILNKIMYVGV